MRGGKLEIGGKAYLSDGKTANKANSGSIVIKDANDNQLIKLDKAGMTLDSSVKISYSDNLSGAPTNISEFNNDSGFMTQVTADDITTGTMLADRIRGGSLAVGGKNIVSNVSRDGSIVVKNRDDEDLVKLDATGSQIGGFTIEKDNLHVGGSGSGVWITGADKEGCPKGYVAVGEHGMGLVRIGYKHNGRIGIALEINGHTKRFVDLWELGDDI